MKGSLLAGLCALALAAPAPASVTKAEQEGMTPAEALSRLKAGNDRFASGKVPKRDLRGEVAATAHDQHPFAAVLGCMDSRSSPELVFGQGIGDIFSVRLAGHAADADAVGSLEYAVKAAGAKLVVVLGHSHCGAVKGACDGVKLGSLTGLLERLKPAVRAAAAGGRACSSKDPASVDAAARAHVAETLKALRAASPILAGLEKSGAVALAGAFYDVETGRAEFLERR